VLCVNAGIGLGGPFAETDLQRELKMVDLNVRGAIQLTKLVLKDMVARDRGKLLFTSSISATMPGSSVDPLTLCLVPARGRASPACTMGPASSGTKIAAKGSYDEAVVEPRKATACAVRGEMCGTTSHMAGRPTTCRQPSLQLFLLGNVSIPLTSRRRVSIERASFVRSSASFCWRSLPNRLSIAAMESAPIGRPSCPRMATPMPHEPGSSIPGFNA
jgi:short chain dehydrogenase